MALLGPLIVPVIIVAIGLFYLCARLNLENTMTGIVLAHVVLTIPFVVGTTSSAPAQVDLNIGKAARNLGATGAQTFLTIALPQIRPALMPGALRLHHLARRGGDLELHLRGGENTTLTKKMLSGLRDEVDPTIAAVSSLLIGVTVVLLLAVILPSRRGGERQAPGRSKNPRTVPDRAGGYAG